VTRARWSAPASVEPTTDTHPTITLTDSDETYLAMARVIRDDGGPALWKDGMGRLYVEDKNEPGRILKINSGAIWIRLVDGAKFVTPRGRPTDITQGMARKFIKRLLHYPRCFEATRHATLSTIKSTI
jgi:hypothetical protein